MALVYFRKPHLDGDTSEDTGYFWSITTGGRDWDFAKPRISRSPEEAEALLSVIHRCFYEDFMEDADILEHLEQNHNTLLSARDLRCLRMSVGVRRRWNTDDHALHDAEIRNDLAKELARGQSISYGCEMTYTYLKQLEMPVTRDRAFQILKELDPEGVASRTFGKENTPRGEYHVAWPNRVLSVDGHHKLSDYGIEIYAGIDAYSRYIVFIHVGISTRTAVAVLKIFLEHLSRSRILPTSIRSDHGSEVGLMANAQWQLHRALTADIPLHEVYWWGTSTSNQRIESWWLQMSRRQKLIWKEYFDALKRTGKFTNTKSDQIALLFVYIPIIRQNVYRFASLWNAHKIRKQKSRPHVPHGRPRKLYKSPSTGVRDYGKPVDIPTLTRLRSLVTAYDPDEYLPEETMIWCTTALRNSGFTFAAFYPRNCFLPSDINPSAPQYVAMYSCLRRALFLTGAGNILPMTEKPTDPHEWLATHNLLSDELPQVDFEGRDNNYEEGEPEYD